MNENLENSVPPEDSAGDAPGQGIESMGSSRRSSVPVDREQTVISTRPPIYSAESGVFLAPSEIGPTLVGRNLSHFKLLQFVGGGGMGAVFKAVDTMLQRVVAVKVLSRDQGRDEETVKRFQNEAHSTARLDHENIARVYFVGEDDGWYFIVFEYIEGTNLRDLVDSAGPLDGQTAFRMTLQVAEALDHASKRDVVHRDIKPSNVLVTQDGRAKLVDMGLARLHHVHTNQDDLTATGVTLGTFDYISPEQARDPRAADVRSDIYSLGCTLFFMLTGRPPFPDGTVLQKLLSHSSESPPDLAEWRSDIPQEFNLVLQRMLTKKPKDRYQKPSDLIGDLVLVADQYGWQLLTRGEPIFIAPIRSRFLWATTHLPWTVPVALFFFFMVFLDPIWLSNQISSMPHLSFHDLTAAETTNVTGRNENEPSPHQPSKSHPVEDVQEETDSGPDGQRVTDTLDPDADDTSTSLTNSAIFRDPASVTVIVTSDASSAPSTAGRIFENLSKAVSFAAEQQDIERIEIWNNGMNAVSANISMRNRRLVIAAGKDFQPSIGWSSTHDQNSILQIAGGELGLENIHFDMKLPSNSILDRYSVFEITESSQISLSDCTVTVRDLRGERDSNRDAAIFRIAPAEADSVGSDQPNPTETKIDLENCSIRGEATVVRSFASVPLDFQWRNGLLVTSERLIRFPGAKNNLKRKIWLEFTNVTAIMDQGLTSFSTNTVNPNLLDTTIVANDCIFVTKSWASLTSWSHPMKKSMDETEFAYRGGGNLYEGMTSMARFHNVNAGEMPVNSVNLQEWIGSRNVRDPNARADTVSWLNWPTDDRPISKHLKKDYQVRSSIDPESNNGRHAGFDPKTLPEFKPDDDRPALKSFFPPL